MVIWKGLITKMICTILGYNLCDLMTCLNLFEWTDFLVLRNAIFDIHDYNQYVLDFLF